MLNEEFAKQVISYIKKVPKGKVASYGQIAKLAGKPQGSRGVGWLLHSSSKLYKLPWHRIINSQGKISFPKDSSYFRKQRNLLKAEGVEVSREGKVNMTIYQWKKAPAKAKRATKSPRMFSNV